MKIGPPDLKSIPSSETMQDFFNCEVVRYEAAKAKHQQAVDEERATNNAMVAWANLLDVYYGMKVKWPD